MRRGSRRRCHGDRRAGRCACWPGPRPRAAHRRRVEVGRAPAAPAAACTSSRRSGAPKRVRMRLDHVPVAVGGHEPVAGHATSAGTANGAAEARGTRRPGHDRGSRSTAPPGRRVGTTGRPRIGARRPARRGSPRRRPRATAPRPPVERRGYGRERAAAVRASPQRHAATTPASSSEVRPTARARRARAWADPLVGTAGPASRKWCDGVVTGADHPAWLHGDEAGRARAAPGPGRRATSARRAPRGRAAPARGERRATGRPPSSVTATRIAGRGRRGVHDGSREHAHGGETSRRRRGRAARSPGLAKRRVVALTGCSASAAATSGETMRLPAQPGQVVRVALVQVLERERRRRRRCP